MFEVSGVMVRDHHNSNDKWSKLLSVCWTNGDDETDSICGRGILNVTIRIIIIQILSKIDLQVKKTNTTNNRKNTEQKDRHR